MNANLLLDDVFGVETPEGGRRALSIPALLATLGQGQVESFTGVQRHQADAFHIFLCYLAGAVLNLREETNAVQSEDFWRASIRELTGRDDDCAWTLLVEDIAKPAFGQPPLDSSISLSSFTGQYFTPEGIDILQLAKNHDRKRARAPSAPAESWAYSLITIQSMAGYLGGKREISRMNSGSGSRVCVETMRSGNPSERWHRCVEVLLASLREFLPPHKPYRTDGIFLVWTVPWNGGRGIAVDALHPFYLEIARMIRLVNARDSIVALDRRTSNNRIEAKALKGNLGDPWTPINSEKSAALTVPEGGFTPRLLRDLIVGTGKLIPSRMQALEFGEGDSWLHASVLVGGQGTTGGFHEANVRITKKARMLLLGSREDTDRLGELSEWALSVASKMHWNVLRRSLFCLLEGGPEREPNTSRREASQWVRKWLDRYEQRWSSEYFPWLWKCIDRGDETARAAWIDELRTLAEQVLNDALNAAPQRTGRRYRGKVRATSLFHRALMKNFQEEIDHATE